MINFNTSKSLNIVLANTNKALSEVLKSITPKELETLSKGKDLKSIVSTLLEQSTKDSSGDKKLLALLKENPTFKDLSSVSSSIKELYQTLQKEKNPLPLEKQLTSFLSNIKNISEVDLKTKIENSGLFLENKIKNLQTPQVALKSALSELTKVLDATKLANVETINRQLKELLASDMFKNISNKDLLTSLKSDLSSLTTLSKNTQNILEQFSQRLNSPVERQLQPNDVLFSKETKSLFDKINLLNKPESLYTQASAKELFSQDLKALLLKAQEEIKNSSSPNKMELLKQIDKLTLQIDYHQLLSQLSNATSLYIPYTWDALEDGNITIKSSKDDRFFTDIELNLKEYGSLKLRLGMFEKNQLNINISAQSKELKKILQENIGTLKRQLIGENIMPISIRFLDDTAPVTSAYNEYSQELNAGFEAKA
ncbi:flagellar hook-length control protein FliK [Sulfurimonas sp. SAG-AH-194-L11]|nr:flagellar hook-length control protein FliK [Sulfurimonas sp. SAG-AH-194-L11]MDF1877571.1 flagellar hook-length control protein FliK [Sulfurimonas sp. SAG-AH-194-L11]